MSIINHLNNIKSVPWAMNVSPFIGLSSVLWGLICSPPLSWLELEKSVKNKWHLSLFLKSIRKHLSLLPLEWSIGCLVAMIFPRFPLSDWHCYILEEVIHFYQRIQVSCWIRVFVSLYLCRFSNVIIFGGLLFNNYSYCDLWIWVGWDC